MLAGGAFGACPFAEVAEGLTQHVAVEEDDGVEGLVLGGCGGAWGELFEVAADALFSGLLRVLPDVPGKTCDPSSIAGFGVVGQPAHAADKTHLFKGVSDGHSVVLLGLLTLLVWIISVL